MSESPSARETVSEWLRYAEDDLILAERDTKSDAPIYHTICFLCQGSAEKYLKAFLISSGWKLTKTHDILALLATCKKYDAQLASMHAEGRPLNEYITTGRYPIDIRLARIGKAEAEEALAAARRIRDRVLELMRK